MCIASCSGIQLLPLPSFPFELVLTSCQSYHICSGVGGMRSFSSCSAVMPRSVKRYTVSTVLCWGGGGVGYPRPGCFGSKKPWWQCRLQVQASDQRLSPTAIRLQTLTLGSGYGGAGFGSRGGGALGTCTPIAKVTVSEHLLQLLELEMDQTFSL